MKQKRFWLRGIFAGLLAYILFFAISCALVFGGVISCNIFITNGPGVKDNVLCVPILTLAGIPLMASGEIMEDILSSQITHPGLYLGLGVSIVVYFVIWAFLGYLYGKNKNRS